MFYRLFLVLILFLIFYCILNVNCIEKDFDLTLIELQKVLNINECDLILASQEYGFQVFIYRDANKNNFLMINIYSKQIKEIQNANKLNDFTHKFCNLDSTIKNKILNSKIDSVDFNLRRHIFDDYELFLKEGEFINNINK